MKNRVLSALFIYSILVVTEIVVWITSGYLNFSLFTMNQYSSIYGMVACKILSFALVLVMTNFKNIKKGQPVPTSNWFSIATIPAASLYLMLLLFQANGLTSFEVLSGILLILLINFATFYLYDKITDVLSERMNSLLALEQNKYYNKQLEMIKSSLQATSTIRHDLKNHMFTIRTLVENSESESTLSYISKIMDEIVTKKEYAASGNTVIDSIINFKLQEAEQSGIRTAVDLKIPDKLEIPPFDMTVILGNLLDNAITAAGAVEENPYINLKIKFDKGRLLIQMDNPYIGEIKEEDGRILTKNMDHDSHGIGLQNITKIIQKYDGIINIDHSGNIFVVSLLMYVD
jgi:sensor histidine kinase YesM